MHTAGWQMPPDQTEAPGKRLRYTGAPVHATPSSTALLGLPLTSAPATPRRTSQAAAGAWSWRVAGFWDKGELPLEPHGLPRHTLFRRNNSY